MKKNHVIRAVLISLLMGGQPLIAQTQIPSEKNRSGLVVRAKKEYRSFKDALTCMRQKGFRACSPAQKRRIVAAGIALMAVVAAVVYGGVRVAHWRLEQQKAKAELEKLKKDYPYRNFGELLFTAAGVGEVGAAKLLLDRVVNINVKDMDGNTPLHEAAKNGPKEIVRLLLEKGADLESRNNDGGTPLHGAAKNDREEIVRLLLEKGADLESMNNYGRTPLNEAAKKGNEKIVRLLLDKGADPLARGTYGSTPLENARTDEIKKLIQSAIDRRKARAQSIDARQVLDEIRLGKHQATFFASRKTRA